MPLATLVDDLEGQIVLIPAGFELPGGFCFDGDKADVQWEDRCLKLTPAGSSRGQRENV